MGSTDKLAEDTKLFLTVCPCYQKPLDKRFRILVIKQLSQLQGVSRKT